LLSPPYLTNARRLFYYCTFFPPAKQDVKKLSILNIAAKSFFTRLSLSVPEL
jgi:hypothetical protein